jgi:hypothetical protein
MKFQRTITILVLVIALLAILATTTALFSSEGNGEYVYTSIHGEDVVIYGKGLYKHMSSEVAVQGLAQDVITLVVGVPLLLFGLFSARRDSLKGRFLLSGVLMYFLLTYQFFLAMAMFNTMFLTYVVLLSCSFFAFILLILQMKPATLMAAFHERTPVKWVGGFLVFNALLIGMQWLQVVVPAVIANKPPVGIEHYTTMIVQGYDLAIYIPASLLAGILLFTKKPLGYVLAPVYITFLSMIMLALTSKIVGMWLTGYEVFPVIILFPVLLILTLTNASLMYRNVRPTSQ